MSAPKPHVRVKICGIRTSKDLDAAEGADLIGVVLDVPASPRSRSMAEARALFQRAEGRFRTVAVLVSPDARRVREVLSEAAPDLVQVHGPVPDGLSREELARVVPSIGVPPVRPGVAAPPPAAVSPPPGHLLVHLDTSAGPLPGGTGRPSDWRVCRQYVERNPQVRFLLGGGLTPENVLQALAEVGPYGVDVSSGVEARPGEKSRAKVEAFLASVRGFERGTEPPAGERRDPEGA